MLLDINKNLRRGRRENTFLGYINIIQINSCQSISRAEFYFMSGRTDNRYIISLFILANNEYLQWIFILTYDSFNVRTKTSKNSYFRLFLEFV